mmetsp:Transcript_22/g.33  ORF Transcript_22/g.33 Transcript_22/m.33 type:complete len:208 (+) Transcript_22:2880-3503(+)
MHDNQSNVGSARKHNSNQNCSCCSPQVYSQFSSALRICVVQRCHFFVQGCSVDEQHRAPESTFAKVLGDELADHPQRKHIAQIEAAVPKFSPDTTVVAHNVVLQIVHIGEVPPNPPPDVTAAVYVAIGPSNKCPPLQHLLAKRRQDSLPDHPNQQQQAPPSFSTFPHTFQIPYHPPTHFPRRSHPTQPASISRTWACSGIDTEVFLP